MLASLQTPRPAPHGFPTSADRQPAGLHYGFVSTYPPTLCGLATFTFALAAQLAPTHRTVVCLMDAGTLPPAHPVHSPQEPLSLYPGHPASLRAAVAALADCDVVILQHEYGVYGGPDGQEVLDLLQALSSPTVVVLHTVLTTPSSHQQSILEEIALLADAVVVMTPTAHSYLKLHYQVDMTKVHLIPHGADSALLEALPSSRGHVSSSNTASPLVLTWGLLGPGKGIEWAIEAMSHLGDLTPPVRYVVAGQTHPKVLAHQGDAYRHQLQSQIHALKLDQQVYLDDHYRTTDQLAQLIQSADVVLLPYDSLDQVTSGVLIEAVAALKPVISTSFPHAVELLSKGAGVLVPQKDPLAMADALRAILTHPTLATSMQAASALTAPELLWPMVAKRYRTLAHQLTHQPVTMTA